MARITEIIKSPYEMFFGADGLFSDVGRGRRISSSFLWGLPAVVLAAFGGLFVLASAWGGDQRIADVYVERVEEIRERRSALAKEMNLEARMNSIAGQAAAEESAEDPRQTEIDELLAEEEVCLKKLNSLQAEDPKHLYELALIYIGRKKQAQGLALMKRLAPLESTGYANAHMYIAHHLQNAKSRNVGQRKQLLEIANQHLDRALVRDENNLTALGLKTQVLLDLGKPRDAQQFMKRYFEIQPGSFKDLCQLNAAIGLGDENLAVLHSARSRFDQQILSLENLSQARLQLAGLIMDCDLRLRNIEEARKTVQRELKQAESNPELAEELGVKRWANRLLSVLKLQEYYNNGKMKSEDVAQQLQLLREGFELDPSNWRLLQEISLLQAEEQPAVRDAAIAIYDAREKPDATPQVDNVLGVIALGESRFDDALKLFARASKKDKANPEYLNNVAYAMMSLAEEKHITAVQEQQAAKAALGQEDSQENRDAWERCAARSLITKQAQIEAGQEAEKDVDRAVRVLASQSKKISFLSNFYDTKGRALMFQEKYNLAAAEFLRAAAGRPDNFKIAKSIRDCYRKDGQDQRAEMWEKKYQYLLSQSDDQP